MRKLIVVIYFIFLIRGLHAFSPMQLFWKTKQIYKHCDSTSFRCITFSKQQDIRRIFKSEYFFQMKRKLSGFHWYAYDYSHFDSETCIVSRYDAKLKKIFYTDSSKKMVGWPYKFDPLDGPPYIWKTIELPFESELVFKRIYRFVSQNSGIYLYESTGRNSVLRLYINCTNLLIEKMVHSEPNGYYDSSIFDYSVFVSKKTHYVSSSFSSVYFPISLTNNYIKARIDTIRNRHHKRKYNPNHSPLQPNDTQQYVLLDFWYIGCYACRKGIPILSDITRHNMNLKIIGINVHDDSLDVLNFHEKYAIPFTLRCDSNLYFNDQYNIKMYPTLILLSPNGKEIWRHEGYIPDLYLELKKYVK